MSILNAIKEFAREKGIKLFRKEFISNKTFQIDSLPKTIQQFEKIADLSSPFNTAALTLFALTNYKHNKEESIKMLNYLKGKELLCLIDIQELDQAFMDNNEYVLNSYYIGADANNNFQPQRPYSIQIKADEYSFIKANYATLFLTSSLDKQVHSIILHRKGSTEQWFLSQQNIIVSQKTKVESDKI